MEKFASCVGAFTFTGELKLTADLTDTRSSSSSSSAWDWEGKTREGRSLLRMDYRRRDSSADTSRDIEDFEDFNHKTLTTSCSFIFSLWLFS